MLDDFDLLARDTQSLVGDTQQEIYGALGDTQALAADGSEAKGTGAAASMGNKTEAAASSSTHAAPSSSADLQEPDAEPLDPSLAALVQQESGVRCPEPRVPKDLKEYVQDLVVADPDPAVNPVKQMDKQEVKRRKLEAKPQAGQGAKELSGPAAEPPDLGEGSAGGGDLAPIEPILAALGLPREAYPQEPQRGKFSYTIRSKTGARVEVQHRKQRFYVKQTASRDKPELRTIAFNAQNAAEQWAYCKQTCGW